MRRTFLKIAPFIIAIFTTSLIIFSNDTHAVSYGNAVHGTGNSLNNGGAGGGADCDAKGDTGWGAKASVSCGASFRIYKWGTAISNIDEDQGQYAVVSVSYNTETDTVTIGNWDRNGGNPLNGGTITGCQKANYYIRFGYEMIGGLNGNANRSYQVGLGEVNALSDSTITGTPSAITWSQNVQTLTQVKEYGLTTRNASLQYQGGGAVDIDSVQNPTTYKIDYNALKQLADGEAGQHGVKVSLALAARIFYDLGHTADPNNPSQSLLGSGWNINSPWNENNWNDLKPLLSATDSAGRGVGALCIDFQNLIGQTEYIATKSGIEYSPIDEYEGYGGSDFSSSVQSEWTGFSTNPNDNHVAYKKVTLSQEDYKDSVRVRFRHAALFGLQETRPNAGCINSSVDEDRQNWPIQDPIINTTYWIYNSLNDGDQTFMSGGLVSTDCTEIKESPPYNTTTKLWRTGNTTESMGQWVYDFMRYYDVKLTDIKNGGTVVYCEVINLEYKNYILKTDGSGYDKVKTDVNTEFTKACIEITVEAAPEEEPGTQTSCTNDGKIATAYAEYGNTTAYSGVQNLNPNSDNNYGWHNTDPYFNGGVTYRYVYAKPGDGVQFHHCLTFGAQAVRGSGSSSEAYPSPSTPQNWFQLYSTVDYNNSEASELTDLEVARYLFRNANNYHGQDASTRYYIPRYTPKPYDFISSFDQTRVRNYAVLMESPSLSASGYNCARYLGALDQSPPGYQIHGLVGPAYDCAASSASTGVTASDVGRIITQHINWNYVEAWRLRYQNGAGGECIGCKNGKNLRWDHNAFNRSYDAAKNRSRSQLYDYLYTCNCISPCTTCGDKPCGTDCSSHTARTYDVVNNVHLPIEIDDECMTKNDEAKPGNHQFGCSVDKWADENLTSQQYSQLYDTATSALQKSASVIVPYNFTTSVASTAQNAKLGARAGETVETTVKVRVNPRINKDVDPDTSYATIMPKKSKIEVVEFVIDDSVDFNTASNNTGNGVGHTSSTYGIDEGFMSDADGSHSICEYFRSVTASGRPSGETLSDHCNTVNLVSRDELSITNLGFNVGGSLSGDTYTANLTTTVPDVEVGQKYCVAVGVYPADSHDVFNTASPDTTVDLSTGANDLANSVNGVLNTGTHWHISRATCRSVTKEPNFQAWNGDIKTPYAHTTVTAKAVANGFSGSANRDQVNAAYRYDQPAHYLYGSWGENNVLFGNAIIGNYDLASGATVGYQKVDSQLSQALNPHYGDSPGGHTTRVTSSSGLGNEDFCNLAPLTLPNDTVCSSGSGRGVSVDSSSILNKLRSRYITPIREQATLASDISGINYHTITTGNTDNNQKTYYYLYAEGDITLSASNPIFKKAASDSQADPTYIIYTTGTVTIESNLCYSGNASCLNSSNGTAKIFTRSSDARPGFNNVNFYDTFTNNLLASGDTGYDSIDQLPQALIFAKDIWIAPQVTQIDAWLIAIGNDIGGDFREATGTIDTCYNFARQSTEADDTISTRDSVSYSSNRCANQLVVNGPTFAGTLLLHRTAGAYPGSGVVEDGGEDPRQQNIMNDGSVTPAEIFNFRADAYLWAYGQAQDTRQAETTYTRELPPRY